MKSIHPLKMSHSTIQETIVNKLRACAEQVFDELGPDYSEATYQNAFEVECQLRKIHFVRQPTLNILYKGNIVGFQRPDMIVENEVVIEMKACREMNAGSRHLQNWESQLRNYLKNNHMCGLLIIFGTQHAKCKFIQNSEQRPNKKSKVCPSITRTFAGNAKPTNAGNAKPTDAGNAKPIASSTTRTFASSTTRRTALKTPTLKTPTIKTPTINR